MKQSIFFMWVILLVGSFSADGQKTIQPKGLEYEYKGIVYSKERAYNATIHTNGFLVGVDLGKLRTYYKTTFYHFSLGYIKHPLEESQNKNNPFDGLGAPKSFTYGKQNSLYLLRGAYGVKTYKSEKSKRRGLAVGWSYVIGPVIGVLKPTRNIYTVFNESKGFKEPIELTYKDDPEKFLDYADIYGRSSSYDSWGDLSFRPGLHTKIAAHFSKGAFEQYVRAVEVGVMADFFGVKVPILVENEAHSNDALFLNLFLTVQFGKRK